MSRLLAAFYFLFLVLFLLQPQSIHAEEPAPEALPEVVVSSTRLPGDPVDPRTLPAKVTVITAEDIARSGAKTVQEAIQWSTGIVMFDEVGNAFEQRVDLRGLRNHPLPATSDLLDGVRVNEEGVNGLRFYLTRYCPVERVEESGDGPVLLAKSE